MGLFKDVKKPVIKAAPASASEISSLRPVFAAKTPPCSSNCPNGSQLRDLLVVIAQAKDYGLSTDQAFERAWQRIVERNPLPAVTARVCPHFCESACNRGSKDGAVAIHTIERMLGDFGLARKLKLPSTGGTRHFERVAVVGAGPAGLSCAYQLVRRGYGVTIFDGFPLPGGMLRYGIPESRLSRWVLDAEIGRLLELGIELRGNCRIGRDISLEQLQSEYKSVFVGTGAWQGVPLNVPGENARNVIGALDFLRRFNNGDGIKVGEEVVVIGAGPTSVDVAHACKRLGALVTIVGAEITAADWQIAALRAEGVQIEPPAVPLAILTERRCAIGVRCAYLPAAVRECPDFAGHSGAEFELEASLVIVAANREPDVCGFKAVSNGSAWFRTDEWGRASSGIFAGGDNTGLGSVTHAIAKGRVAAEAIDCQLRGVTPEKPAALPVSAAEKMKLEWYPPMARELEKIEGHRLDAAETVEWQADAIMNEAKRCMSCGMCMDCESCWMYCTPNCFVRLPKGEHCRIKLELCNGCKKCAEACPTGYIEMV